MKMPVDTVDAIDAEIAATVAPLVDAEAQQQLSELDPRLRLNDLVWQSEKALNNLLHAAARTFPHFGYPLRAYLLDAQEFVTGGCRR